MISDEQIKVVYNTSAFEKAQDPRLRALLQYLSTATVPIADKVAAFKRLFPDGRPHMKYELDLYDKWREGRAEGIKEGIEQGLEKGIEIGEAKGREEGLSEGLKKGRDEAILQTAITALKQGIPAETVASFTGLSVLEVEALKNKV